MPHALIVEDDLTFLLAFAEVVRREGFSIATARKKLAWLRVQSRTSASSGIAGASCAATAGAANMSSSLRRTPVALSSR